MPVKVESTKQSEIGYANALRKGQQFQQYNDYIDTRENVEELRAENNETRNTDGRCIMGSPNKGPDSDGVASSVDKSELFQVAGLNSPSLVSTGGYGNMPFAKKKPLVYRPGMLQGPQ